jgi:hypothetical protein
MNDRHGDNRINARGLLLVFMSLFLSSCFSGRTEHVFIVDGQRVSCFEPPPDVVQRNTGASLNIAVYEIGEVLKAGGDLKTEAQRIREVSKGVNDFEVIEWRICTQYANRVFPKDQYHKFLFEVLPLLKDQSAKPVAINNTTETEARFDAQLKEARFFHLPKRKMTKAEFTWLLKPLTKQNGQVANVIFGLATIHDAELLVNSESQSMKGCIEIPSCLQLQVWNRNSNPLLVSGDSDGSTFTEDFLIPDRIRLLWVGWVFYQREADSNNFCIVDTSRKAPKDGIPFLKVVTVDGSEVYDDCYKSSDSRTFVISYGKNENG